MAKEKYTVIYGMQEAGTQQLANWKEKEVKTKSGEKNAGYTVGEGLKVGEMLMAKVITIEAESAEEAAQAVRVFYGQGTMTNSKCLAGASSGLSEVNSIP